jgi:Flp pilus assembly protein TadG
MIRDFRRTASRLASRCAGARARLLRDTSGVAMLEFAFAAPMVLMIGLYGIEASNMALANLRVSQIALNLADNMSRVGLINSSQIEQLRESDVNDVLQAARTQGEGMKLTTNGRITVSSLEADDTGVQRIHWQRCIGQMAGTSYDSTYGMTTTGVASNVGAYDPNAGVNTATGSNPDNSALHPGSLAVGAAGGPVLVGMGDTAADAIKAPNSGGVIFVEINYKYQPVVGNWLYGVSRIHYIASFIVRDNRDFSQLFNPSPAVTTANKTTCNLYGV